MKCPNCGYGHKVETKGYINVSVDSPIGYSEHRLIAWLCTFCKFAFYADSN